MKVNKIRTGDKVAIVSLSSGILGEEFVRHQLKLGVTRIKELGLIPAFMDNSLKGIDILKENPKLRADDLKQAFADDSVNAIICAIGGDDTYLLTDHLLSDKIFVDNVKNNPKKYFWDFLIQQLIIYYFTS